MQLCQWLLSPVWLVLWILIRCWKLLRGLWWPRPRSNPSSIYLYQAYNGSWLCMHAHWCLVAHWLPSSNWIGHSWSSQGSYCRWGGDWWVSNSWVSEGPPSLVMEQQSHVSFDWQICIMQYKVTWLNFLMTFLASVWDQMASSKKSIKSSNETLLENIILVLIICTNFLQS